VVEYGGHAGAVVDLTESAAVIRVGGAHLKVPFGSDVRVQGLSVVLGDPNAEPVAQNTKAYEGALRQWRSEAAKRATVPAYVVLNDSELVGIAARRPTTPAELARCKGMGPIRLERWGDELLAVLNAMDSD
jgi:superfamily II DNA helicase RecQ